MVRNRGKSKARLAAETKLVSFLVNYQEVGELLDGRGFVVGEEGLFEDNMYSLYPGRDFIKGDLFVRLVKPQIVEGRNISTGAKVYSVHDDKFDVYMRAVGGVNPLVAGLLRYIGVEDRFLTHLDRPSVWTFGGESVPAVSLLRSRYGQRVDAVVGQVDRLEGFLENYQQVLSGLDQYKL